MVVSGLFAHTLTTALSPPADATAVDAAPAARTTAIEAAETSAIIATPFPV